MLNLFLPTDAVEIYGTEDVNEGEQIKLICYFTDENINYLGWYKNYLVLNGVDAVSTVKYEEDWIRTDLTISEATLHDAGEYSCKAYSSDGHTETGRIEVHVAG